MLHGIGLSGALLDLDSSELHMMHCRVMKACLSYCAPEAAAV